MKSKIIFTNYIDNHLHDGGKSVSHCRVVSCKPCSTALRFSVRKNVTKKKKKKSDPWVTLGWTDIRGPGPGPASFLTRGSIYHRMLILCNSIKPLSLAQPLNVISTNSFSWASNFISTKWWRLHLAQINNFNQNPFALPPICQE